MRFQVVYETDADYIETWKKLRANPQVATIRQTPKGHLCFRFKDTGLTAELAEATGKLLVNYKDEREKQVYFRLIREILVKRDGSQAKIHPLHTTVYAIPLDPPPSEFRFSTCKTVIQYARVRRLPIIMILLGVAAMAILCWWSLQHATPNTMHAIDVNASSISLFVQNEFIISMFSYVLATIAAVFMVLALLEIEYSLTSKVRNIFLG
jgi:hypothetical protein